MGLHVYLGPVTDRPGACPPLAFSKFALTWTPLWWLRRSLWPRVRLRDSGEVTLPLLSEPSEGNGQALEPCQPPALRPTSCPWLSWPG